MASSKPITLQTGIREYNYDMSEYTGMLGGLTPDIHTLKSLNPETTNRVIAVMYRGPYFMRKYLSPENNYDGKSLFTTYKKVIEYYNMGIQCNFNSLDLASAQLKGGFAGRSINFPTQQNAQSNQTLTFTVPELVGRPMANFHNMWSEGIADSITGLTTYNGLVSGSEDSNGTQYRIFYENLEDASNLVALEPSPAWEVAEFLIIALDRSGARVEGAVAALGCVPTAKVGMDIFTYNSSGNSDTQKLTLTYNCQFVQSAYINDLATRYVKQFAIFGHSNNFNPCAGDAFFTISSDGTKASDAIDSSTFNGGQRPTLDAVQTSIGNAPVFYANNKPVKRQSMQSRSLETIDHFRRYHDGNKSYENDTTFDEQYAYMPDPYTRATSNSSSSSSSTSGAGQTTGYGGASIDYSNTPDYRT